MIRGYRLTLSLAVCLAVIIECLAHSQDHEYSLTSESSTSSHRVEEDRLLANIVRGRNATQQSFQQKVDGNGESSAEKKEKKPRTTVFEAKDAKGLNCCGSRYSSVPSVRPDNNYNRLPYETGRYPFYYGERVSDRYNWQTYNRPPTSSGSSGSSGRPPNGNYGGNYPGSSVYGGSQHGDSGRYPPSSNRPGSSGYGGGYGGSYGGNSGGNYGGSYSHSRPHPGNDYGISGTFGDGSEFDGSDEPPAYPDESPSQDANIQTQKAVALKALAGVALIGAAAALASNPVLLPLGLIAGRKKRSENSAGEADLEMDRILNALTINISKAFREKGANKVIVSPRCVARMTCDVQRAYAADLKRNADSFDLDEKADHRFTNLIRSKVLNSSTVNASVKKLIKLGITVGSNEGDCNVFPCNFISEG